MLNLLKGAPLSHKLSARSIASSRSLALCLTAGVWLSKRPFRGGLVRYADSLGVAEVVRRLETIAAAPDVVARAGGAEKFTPAPWLKERAARGGSLFA